MSQAVPKIIYYANFHSNMKYGLTFWGKSPRSEKIFKVQGMQFDLLQDTELEIGVEIYLRI
jgi:hypothetical protein